MRTRVYDYLWGGLPIVTSSAPGTDELITRYGAGVIVRDDDGYPDAILGALRRRDDMSAAAQTFVAEHQWSRTLAPLLAFCREPRIDARKSEFAVSLNVPDHPPSILDRIKRRIGGSF